MVSEPIVSSESMPEIRLQMVWNSKSMAKTNQQVDVQASRHIGESMAVTGRSSRLVSPNGATRKVEEVTVREIDDLLDLRLDKLENTFAEQNSKMEKQFAELLQALRLNRLEKVLGDPIAELKQLKETNDIVEYHKEFELLRSRVNLTEDYLVKAYLDCLQIDTQVNVQMFQPQTIQQCFLIGRLYEQAHPRSNVDDRKIFSLKRDSALKAEEDNELTAMGVEIESIGLEGNLEHGSNIEEELTPQFQVPIVDSELCKSIEPREENLGLGNLGTVVMNENLEQEEVPKYSNKRFEVESGVERGDKLLSIKKNCSGKISQYKEMLGIKKKTRGYKSWRLKFKQKLAPRDFSFGFEVTSHHDSISDISKVLKGLVNCEQATVLHAKLIVGQVCDRMLHRSHRLQHQRKKGKGSKSWMCKYRNRKHRIKRLHNHDIYLAVCCDGKSGWLRNTQNSQQYFRLEVNTSEVGSLTEFVHVLVKLQSDSVNGVARAAFGVVVGDKKLNVCIHMKQQKKTWKFKFKEMNLQRILAQLDNKGEFRFLHSISGLVFLILVTYESLGLMENLSDDGSRRAPLLNMAAKQPILGAGLQDNSKNMHKVSEPEKKKKRICYKTWMFKYKYVQEGIKPLFSSTLSITWFSGKVKPHGQFLRFTHVVKVLCVYFSCWIFSYEVFHLQRPPEISTRVLHQKSSLSNRGDLVNAKLCTRTRSFHEPCGQGSLRREALI